MHITKILKKVSENPVKNDINIKQSNIICVKNFTHIVAAAKDINMKIF